MSLLLKCVPGICQRWCCVHVEMNSRKERSEWTHSFSVILEILSHEQWFTTPQFRYTILNVKCFPIIEMSGLDSTRCASSAFYVFSVLCVLWLRNAAQKFYGDVDMWSVYLLCRRLRCAITCALLQLDAFYCLVVHFGVCSCLQTQIIILHLSVVARRCVTFRVSEKPPKQRNVDLSWSRQGRVLQHCLVLSQRAVVGVTMEMSSCRAFVCDLFFFGALTPSHYYTRTQSTCFSVQRCSVSVSFEVAV